MGSPIDQHACLASHAGGWASSILPACPSTVLDGYTPTPAMRHQKTRNKLSRDSAHRKSLLMNLTKEVLEHERIKTSEAKAKAVKPEIEKLITLAKRGDLHARRQALSALSQDKFAVYKLFEEVAPRYADRPGGYTRILKLGPRRSDATEMVYLELV
jgi:large subunit ribosomal protein L17